MPLASLKRLLALKRLLKKQVSQVTEETEELLKKLEYGTFDNVNEYVDVLSEIRNLRGRIVSLRDLMYVDLEVVDKLDESIKEKNVTFSNQCITFFNQSRRTKALRKCSWRTTR